MCPRGLIVTAILIAAAPPGFAQEPETRQQAIEQERAEKSTQLEPYVPGRLERLLLKLENDRFFERLLHPPQGFYPKIGTVTAGSGLAIGPGYRKTDLFHGQAEFSTFAAVSYKKYWMIDATLSAPHLAGSPLFAQVYGRKFEFPQEPFFGLGADSTRSNYTSYNLQNTVVGGSGGVHAGPWLTLGGRLEYLTPTIGRGKLVTAPPVQDIFTDAQVPGLSAQPDFSRYGVFGDFNYREPRGNPRKGGRYYVGYDIYNDRDLNRYSFQRFEADLQQYISLLRERRVLALRARTVLAETDPGKAIPFYFQSTLGGPDDLRGFHRYRFRDQNLVLLQAEYRWEVFTAMDAAIFYDLGKVASRREDLSLRHLQKDYGIGVRFGTDNGVFLRIEGAFGSTDGAHLVLRLGNVF